MIVLYPGSFDPPTLGHIDIIRRASVMFDEVNVCVMVNRGKRHSADAARRVRWIEECVKELPNVRVSADVGLLVDVAKRLHADAVIRGLRSESDYAKEQPVADAIRLLGGIETLFIKSAPMYAHISSSLVRELMSFGGDIASLVPEPILCELNDCDR